MKQIIFIVLTLFSVNAYSQTLYVPNAPDSLKLPIQVAGVVRSVYVTDLNKSKLSLSKYISDSATMRGLINTNTSNISTNTSNISANTTAIARKLDTSGSYINNIVFNNNGLLHTSPATFTYSNHTGTLTQTLANQNPFTILGRGTGIGAPTWLSSIDSNWVSGLHSQAYYDSRYGTLPQQQSNTSAITALQNAAQVTGYQTATATAGQSAFTFTNVPASLNDYQLHVNGGYINQNFYTVSSNTITFTTSLNAGDVVTLHRIK